MLVDDDVAIVEGPSRAGGEGDVDASAGLRRAWSAKECGQGAKDMLLARTLPRWVATPRRGGAGV